jgi:hypothetical protein
LKVYDLRYRENEDNDIFDNTENCTTDPNCCQTHALAALFLRVPESADRSALEADCQEIGDTMQGKENNTKIAGYRKPSLCKYSQVKQEK